jgi:hypothetical protein
MPYLPVLVVIHYLNIMGIPVAPNKADAVLVVHANGMLSFAISLQLFQVVAGRNAKVFNCERSVQDHQLSSRDSPKIGRNAAAPARSPERFSVVVPEACNHDE